jgi:hypothetical protein
MADIPVDVSETPDATARARAVAAEVEREITKRRLIESITAVVLVVLYMAFSLFRDRDPGVVPLDSADDWKA